MRKYIVALVITIWSFLGLNAQNIPYKVAVSKVFKDDSKISYLIHAEETSNGGSVIIRSLESSVMPVPKAYVIEQYDAAMNLTKEFKYEAKSTIMGVTVNSGKVNIIEVDYSKDRKAFVWTAYTSALDNPNFTSIELLELKVKKEPLFHYSPTQKKLIPLFEVVANTDNSAFAIVIDIKGKDARSEVHLFDSALDRKFVYQLSGTGCCGINNYKNMIVSPGGDAIFMLSRVYSSETSRKQEGADYRYDLTKISAAGIEKQTFETGGYFIPSMQVAVSGNTIICAGLYSEKDDTRSKGTCYYRVNMPDMKILSQKYSPFTEQFLTDKYGSVKSKELRYITIKNLKLLASGDVVFNGEEQFLSEKQFVNPNAAVEMSTFKQHFGDIVSLKLNQEGEIIYARNINKNQSASGDYTCLSYTSAVKGDDTYFFINTDKKAANLSGGRVEFGQAALQSWSHLNIVRIKGSGDFDYEEALGESNQNKVPFMTYLGKASGNSVYFLGRDGSGKQLLRITLN